MLRVDGFQFFVWKELWLDHSQNVATFSSRELQFSPPVILLATKTVIDPLPFCAHPLYFWAGYYTRQLSSSSSSSLDEVSFFFYFPFQTTTDRAPSLAMNQEGSLSSRCCCRKRTPSMYYLLWLYQPPNHVSKPPKVAYAFKGWQWGSQNHIGFPLSANWTVF